MVETVATSELAWNGRDTIVEDVAAEGGEHERAAGRSHGNAGIAFAGETAAC